MKRLKHPGNLIRKQQKERKEHGSEERRLRQGSDTNRREPADLSVCVAAGLFIQHHNLLSPVGGEIRDVPRRLWKLVGPDGGPHVRRTLELGAFFHDQYRRQDFSDER